MLPNEVREELRRQPFEPFRLYLSDGTTYEIRHPDLVMVGIQRLLVGVPAEGREGIFQRYDVVSLLHVVRLEPIQVGPSPTSNGQGPNP
jgi:hypothetical protein